MNEPMMMLNRDRDGTLGRRFAAPQALPAAPRVARDPAPRPRLRWFGGGRRAALREQAEPAG